MKRVQLIAFGAILGGIVLGAAWPPPPLPRSTEHANEWIPPATSLERVSRETLNSLKGLRWFGAQSDQDEPGHQAWRLVGIVHAPQPVVLIMTEGKSAQNLRLEAEGVFPDGSRLARIEEDTILVESASCQRTFQVHRRNPIRTSGECAESQDTEQRKSP